MGIAFWISSQRLVARISSANKCVSCSFEVLTVKTEHSMHNSFAKHWHCEDWHNIKMRKQNNDWNPLHPIKTVVVLLFQPQMHDGWVTWHFHCILVMPFFWMHDCSLFCHTPQKTLFTSWFSSTFFQNTIICLVSCSYGQIATRWPTSS